MAKFVLFTAIALSLGACGVPGQRADVAGQPAAISSTDAEAHRSPIGPTNVPLSTSNWVPGSRGGGGGGTGG